MKIKQQLGVRITIGYFNKIKKYLDSGIYEEDEWEKPNLILPSNELLKSLENDISIKKNIEDENKSLEIDILFDLWKLVEYRKKLDINSTIENNWLSELEISYSKIIKNKMKNKSGLNDLIIDILDNKININKEQILEHMHDITKERNFK